jgi:hypothetical protein
MTTHAGATSLGSESQESLQKAAIHMGEVIKRFATLNAAQVDGTCDTSAAVTYALTKIEHHLEKTQTYLGEAIDQVIELGTALLKFDADFGKNERLVFHQAHRVIRPDTHTECGPTSRCFAPRRHDMDRPVRPIV